jgi:hypothetical protein
MAHKKVHPAETKSPQTRDDVTANRPGTPPPLNSVKDGFQDHDAKGRQGAFEGKGEHARQQEMGNKD